MTERLGMDGEELKGLLKSSLELSGAIRDVMTPKGPRFLGQLASSWCSTTLKPLL